MGYSIGFMPRSEALGQRMLAVMRENYRPWPTVAGSKSGQYAGNPTDDMSYDRRKNSIGLDYGVVSGWEREYAYSVVKWMAIRAGRRRSSFAKDAVTPNRFPTPVPYMTYDGCQNWPIFVVSSARGLAAVPKSARWCATDELGMRSEPWRAISSVLFDLPKVNISRALDRAAKKAGPLPPKGDRGSDMTKHRAWHERHQQALYEICKSGYEEGARRMRDELSRLDRLWQEG